MKILEADKTNSANSPLKLMENQFSEIVEEKMQTEFSEFEQKIIREEFEKLYDYFNENETDEFLESDEIERIHLGILILSEGKISEFRDAIKEAKSDWRNVIYWSGMPEGE